MSVNTDVTGLKMIVASDEELVVTRHAKVF